MYVLSTYMKLRSLFLNSKTNLLFHFLNLIFVIKDDPLEEKNLADKHPDIVQLLKSKLEEYKKTHVEPLNAQWITNSEKAHPSYWGDKWSPGWC